ncbi:hypothetical protein D3C83_35900 [compost metagenome]
MRLCTTTCLPLQCVWRKVGATNKMISGLKPAGMSSLLTMPWMSASAAAKKAALAGPINKLA